MFLPNYNVSLAEAIIPAADLSEQISTAGMEASGTGNMKLALNGALTIGTLDGANVEICEHVGADNIFIFGLTADEVAQRRAAGLDAARGDRRLAHAGRGAGRDRVGRVLAGRPQALPPAGRRAAPPRLLHGRADFDAYYQTQRTLGHLRRDSDEWWRRSILNTARMGWFSSDRTIAEYASDIWRAGGAKRQ